MTEEIAEINLAEAWVGENGFGSDCNNLNYVEANRELVTAFLAGLKAGKPKWHKVKSGDLPPEDTKVLAFMTGGEVCIAHFYRKNVWDKIGIVIAWCEIPQYTEE